MPSFSREELDMMSKCLEVADHCEEHGEEATRICTECTQLFCDVCCPTPCQCWQDRIMRTSMGTVKLTHKRLESNKEEGKLGRVLRVIFHHKGKGLGSNPKAGTFNAS